MDTVLHLNTKFDLIKYLAFTSLNELVEKAD